MMTWLQPAALWALALVAVPVLIHLLRTRQAPTVQFPSVRFVRQSPAASVRLGTPSDLLLLAVRTAIVAAAVLAMAQPLLLSNARVGAWNARIARAIVIDTSDSMREAEPGAVPAAGRAAELASAEARTAAASVAIETADLRLGLQRAGRWLATAPPARREIVVLSDFQHGALTEDVVRAVPEEMGVRFIAVGEMPDRRRTPGVALLGAAGVEPRTQHLEISEAAMRVTLQGPDSGVGTRDSGFAGRGSGLRLIGQGNPLEHERLLRAVARAGARAPRADAPVVVAFAPAGAGESAAAVRERWMVETMMRLESDPELNRLARELTAVAAAEAPNRTVLLRARNGASLLRATALDGELALEVAAPIASYFAAAVLRAALEALHGPPGHPELDVLRIPPATLAAWSRPPSAVTEDASAHAESSDARWFWTASLLLMAVEERLRRRRRQAMGAMRAAP